MAQLIGASFGTPKVVGLILGQGTYLGCRLDPKLGCIWEATNRCFHINVFLSLLSPLSQSSQINKHILEWGLKKKSSLKNKAGGGSLPYSLEMFPLSLPGALKARMW